MTFLNYLKFFDLLAFLVLLCFGSLNCSHSLSTFQMPSLSLLTWNVNGSKNVSSVPHALKFVLGHDIVFLQETFELPGGRDFRPHGYLSFANEAVHTGGRPSGGLSVLIKLELVKGAITKLPSPAPWILAVRWAEPGQKPVILVNVYVARFSTNLGPFSAATLDSYLADLRSSYLDHSFIFAGDFNADPYRARSSPDEREILATISSLSSDGFSIFPHSRIPTFSDRGHGSTIDFILCSSDISTSASKVGSPFACQHHPLTTFFELQPAVSLIPEG